MTRDSEELRSPISQGVGRDVLDHLGIGHYPGTQGSGEHGNFAIEAHRQNHGQVFRDIDRLGHGDYLCVQARGGYYTDRYGNTEIVARRIREASPGPPQPGEQATESLLTMTSCDPPFTTRRRIIASAQLHSRRPHGAGPPLLVADTVARATGTD